MNGATFDNQTRREKTNAEPTAGVGQLAHRGGASAFVTHDRDFSRVTGIDILTGD